MLPFLLAANDLEWIKVLIPIVVFLVVTLNKLFGGKQLPKVPPVPRRQQPPERPNAARPGRPAPQPASRTPDSLSAEIEQFLKDAAQRKQDKRRRPTAAPQPTIVLAPVELVTEIEAIEPPTGDAMSKAVTRHLDTQEFALRASQMTDDMKRADADREKHFQKTFSHQIGRLTDTSSQQNESSDAEKQAANSASLGDFSQILASPENLRRAIILNEILQPPEHRW